MKRHIFDGQTRVARDALDPADVTPWEPPGIGKEGNLVYAEPRDTVSRPPPESDPSGSRPRVKPASDSPTDEQSADATGYQEGMARGLEEGRRQGREEGHQEGLRAGYEEGVAAGRTEGLQQGSTEVARQMQTLDSLLAIERDYLALLAEQRAGWRLPYLTLRRGILGEQAWLAWADEVALELRSAD